MKERIRDSKIILSDNGLITPVKPDNFFPVVGIGASAGGLDAFRKFLRAISENSGMAYVLVQHLDPKHESMLPELLQKVTKIPVIEITDDIKVKPNHIYVIPSNKMMIATDGVLLLTPRPEKIKTERYLPIDIFFTSLAEVHQSNAIGVVLSGTASDGTQGLKAIKEHGGITFAQDEESAQYDSMPHNAVQAGVVDFILPPGEIPKKLLEVTYKTSLTDEELQNFPKEDEDVFKQILSLLRIRKGVDFTYYKQTTIRRRILRRIVINKIIEPIDYLKFLRGNNQEQDLLYQDMLIPVTSFFRDKKTFDNLCNSVFPTILKNKIPGAITRIWVAGCSTGQEVYSFAICFKIFLGDTYERIQIFGTDLSEPAILKARSGIYEKNEIETVPPDYLKAYFTKTNGGYQVNKNIRDLCVFAHHNLLKDPPFGKMDCISCRNVLIYMEPFLQKKALTTFHYALKPKGFLLLGKSETTGGVPELFDAVEKNDKLYTRKDVPSRFLQVASQRSEQVLKQYAESSKNEAIRPDFQKTADDILLLKYTPAGVVINEAMDIVHFRGNTANFLEQAPGKPSHNLLLMAKNGLGFELRNILYKSKTDKVSVVKDNIPLRINGSLRYISIEAVPLLNTLEPYYLILFHDHNINNTDGSSIINKKKVSAKTQNDQKDIQILLLEQELAQVREDMRSITEDQEAINEELQSANEELLSGSEELQSLNEELETSKEELQSTNEELTVLNNELISLNEQVTDARNYAETIVAKLYQPLVVLDKNLRIKTANNAFYKTFKVNEQDTEDVLVFDLDNRSWNIPELRTLLEEILPHKKQITDYEVTHNFSSIGERVILLSALEILKEKKEEKLILLSIEDVTERKYSIKKVEESEERFQAAVAAVEGILWTNNANGVMEGEQIGWNLLTGQSYEAYQGLGWTNAVHPDDVFETIETWNKAVKESKNFIFEHRLKLKNNSWGYFSVKAIPLLNDKGKVREWVGVHTDISEQKQSENLLKESEYRFRKMADLMPQKVWTADMAGNYNYFNKCWYDYSGLNFDDLKDYGWKKVIHVEDWEETISRWQQSMATGENFEMEHRFRNTKGIYKWHLSRGLLEKDEYGNRKFWIGTSTEMQHLKEEEQRKGNFIKMVSHELKTPVTSIKGYVQMLLMMLDDNQIIVPNNQIKSSLVRIDKQILNLTRLISEMLDLSRIEDGSLQLKMELFSLNMLIDEIREDILISQPNYIIEVYHDFSATIFADRDRIGQVIINFINNGIKYSPNDNRINIRIYKTEKETISVSIKDFGIGISKENQQRVFERFYRVDGNNEQTFTGFGIGLFISNSIIEKHNGTILINSEVGKGSEFIFTLNLASSKNL